MLQRRRQDREDNLIVGQLVASQNKVPYNYHYDDETIQCYFVEIGREWVREMAELTRKYQTKLEEVQARNKELRLELAEVQV